LAAANFFRVEVLIAVAKNPQDYSSYAVHQLLIEGRCKQGAVR
jgi:hypothetical protein